MAEPQNSVVLNIGSQRVSMAVFEISKNGGLVLKSYDSETVAADPAMTDTARNSQTRVAVADLVKRLKLPKGRARYAISGQSVFIRFVKLPPLQEDSIEQLVTFEAQQHVPFPLSEVVWDYELIEGAVEKEAVIVAIKSDALDDINASVNEGGQGTVEVDVAPMALYNAFHATYGEPEEPILLIDIGAKTSNLLYIEGRRFFTRSVGIGGSSITAAIAKEYSVSFQEAERQKIANGLVALGGGHTEQLDEAVAALAMVIRNALSRLPAEIARTTNYYRSQHGGSAPRRVLLAGGGAALPYTLEFFEEKLNLPVEYFNPVRNVAIGKDVDPAMIQREGHLMGELVGLGLRGTGKSIINIDLVPSVVKKIRADERRKPFFIAAAAILLIGMAVWAVMQLIAGKEAKERSKSMAEQKENLAPVTTQIQKLNATEKALRQIADGYTDVEAGHSAWLDILGEIRGAFASEYVWVTGFEPISGFDLKAALEGKRSSGKSKENMNGSPVVKADFYNTGYGISSLDRTKITTPSAAPVGRGRVAAAAPAPKITANAVSIRGFWRKNPKNQTIVSDLLKQLRDKSDRFVFKTKDDKGKEIILNDAQLIGELSISAEKPGQIAFPFEITLPLAKPVIVE